MTITDIVKVPRKNKYEIYADDVLIATLSDISVINSGFKVGREFCAEEIESILAECTNADCFETLLNILGQTALTEMLAKKKLQQKGYSEQNIEFAIEKAKAYGYINDKEYASSYIKYTTNKSKIRITAELNSKGVDKSLFWELLDEYDELEACKKVMKTSVKCELSDEQKKKLFQRLYMQGFPYDIIKLAYADIIDEL